jgi:alginate O-acetyltransferase complex protein AlgJ
LTTSDRGNVSANDSWHSLSDGGYSKQIDDDVVAAVPGSHSIDGVVAGLEYSFLNDAGAQVRTGCRGWLFLGEELFEVEGGEQNLIDRASLARLFANYFQKRHIRFAMLTVPDKARIERTELCAQQSSDQEQIRLKSWKALALAVPAIQIVSLDGWPSGATYWRTDTHWNRIGARFAAARTAEAVRTALIKDAIELSNVSIAKDSQPRPGDLMHLSNLSNAPLVLRPPADFDRSVAVIWNRAGGLLDTGPPADVLLVGSSFSRNSGFIDSLALDLKHEVVQLGEDGSEFDGSLLDLLEKHRKALAKAKAVIWEFPERSLSQDLTAKERSILAGNAGKNSAF